MSSTRVQFATVFVLGMCGSYSLGGMAQTPQQQLRTDFDALSQGTSSASIPSPCSLSPESNAPALLKRVEDILIAAEKANNSKGTVTIDRTMIDEMRAELEQVRTSLGR